MLLSQSQSQSQIFVSTRQKFNIEYNYIIISGNNKYVSFLKSIFSKNTTHNYTKLQLKLNLFSMNAVYLTLLTKMRV